MREREIRVVRIYLNERSAHLDRLLERLHDEERVRGVTVFRAIAGYGDSGRLHSAKLIDLSLELPIVVEFFDTPERCMTIIEHLRQQIKPDHILSWSAHTFE